MALLVCVAPVAAIALLVGVAPVAAAAQAPVDEATETTPVRVDGTPEGASVVVDRAPFGTLPTEGTLAAGLHYFVVSSPGYYSELRDVEALPSGEPLALRFDLVLDPALQPRGANAPMIVGGSVLALGGVAGLVLAVVGATGERRCSARCDDLGARHVVERPAIDAIVTWSVAGGVALIVGAVIIGFGVTWGERSARAVSLGPSGLRVEF